MQTQPAESLDAVLGRFQAWAGSCEVSEETRGVRELTEEEALRSNRYRWKGIGNASTKKDQREKSASAPVKRETASKARAAANAAKVVPSRAEPARKVFTSPKRAAKPAPQFRQILADALPSAQFGIPAEAAVLRPIALSIRLAPAERTLIKTRAAAAGVSASTYVRQCALEREQLWEQVRDALAAMERGPTTAFQSPETALFRMQGFFTRIVRRLFPKKRLALALRA